MRTAKNLVRLCSFLAVALLSTRAFAADSLALDQFQPAPAGDRFFGVQGADPGGHLVPQLMLLGDYAYKPLVLYRQPGDKEVGVVVSNQLFLHLSAGISLWDRLSVFASMPLALVNSGDSPTIDGTSFRSPSGVAAGDLRAGLRLLLLGELRSAAQLSLSGYIFLPTGKSTSFAGDGQVHGQPALVFAGETDDLAYAVSAGMDIRAKRNFTDATYGSQLTYGAAIGVLLADKVVQIGPEFYGTTGIVGGDKFSRKTTNLEAILGARFRVSDFVFGAGAGPGITHGLGTPTIRVVASIAYAPMPEKPLPPPPPPAPPKKVKPSDRDKDGILDKNDACPDEFGVASDDPLKHGCPVPPDRDEDGIPDKEDACPDAKGVPNTDPSLHGCPPDTDGDGILDDLDACPREKGLPDPDPLKNGCPGKVRVTESEIIILEQVQFKTGSAVILKASDELLQQVANVLNEHPEIRRIEVQGHTDNRGGKAYNKKLSQRRSAAVLQWLVKRGGIDASRLSAQGYGMDEPIASNDTPEDRQKNRRVQFKIVEKGQVSQ